MALDLFVAIHYFMAAFRCWIVNNLRVLLTICSSSSLLLIWRKLITSVCLRGVSRTSSHGFFKMLKTEQARSNSTNSCSGTQWVPAGFGSKIGLDRFCFQLHGQCQGMALNIGHCVCKQSRSFAEVQHSVFGTSKIRIWLPGEQNWGGLRALWEALQRWYKGQWANLCC